MNKNILQPFVQNYINQHLNADLAQLALEGIEFEGITDREVLEQIQAKKKAVKKLPEWSSKKNIYFPPKINLEQTSSSITGKYKSSLVDGESLLDVTGGFGVDSFFFSKKVTEVIHCEINEDLSRIANHNFEQLHANNIACLAIDGIKYLEENKNIKFDWIFLDPARRDNLHRKVFQLKDTTPNILYHLREIFNHTNNILLKTSPLLDISLGINHLENVEEIHVVGIKNEVKELIWKIKKGYTGDVKIITFNFINEDQNKTFSFNYSNEKKIAPHLSTPSTYLYEPNACIMKSGGFSSLAEKYKLDKLHPNSHLYTADKLMDFPGRIFRIEEVIPYNKKTVRKKFGKQKHHVTTRNFTLKVSDIRHLFKLEDGGDSYLFFTTNWKGKKIIIRCSKIVLT